MKNHKKGEWLLVHGENFMSLVPMYYCDVCNNSISGYNPPILCPHCGSMNENKGNIIKVRMEGEDENE